MFPAMLHADAKAAASKSRCGSEETAPTRHHAAQRLATGCRGTTKSGNAVSCGIIGGPNTSTNAASTIRKSTKGSKV
ncbi:hypothetical protein M885DRAFT_524659 [Pelagophyceae sp. CCMP2097]|nr:hypothetical protein M885DRAFT_524659 [Pelagophyceae sp. CCMP2097]